MGKKYKGINTNQKRSAFLPPIRSKVSHTDALIMKKIQEAYNKELTETSNNSFNLGVSAALIAARDMGMSVEETKEFIKRIFGILDDVADDLSRIEEMLLLVKGWGIDVYDTAVAKTQESGKVIEKKTAVFYLLQEGVTEIEDILTKCKLHNINIDYRDACAYRWEFNRKKYYEDMEVDMSKKDVAFGLLDQGKSNTELVEIMGIARSAASQYRYLWNREQEGCTMSRNKEKAFNMISNGASKDDLVKELKITEAAALRFIESYRDEKCEGEIEVITGNMKKAFELFDKAYRNEQVEEELNLSKAALADYRAEWIRINKRDLGTEEMAEILAGTDAAIVILRHKGVLSAKKEEKKNVKSKKHFVPRDSVDQVEQEVEAEKENMDEQENIKEIIETKEEVKVMVAAKKGLRKVVKVIEIQGDVATYEPLSDGVFSINIGEQIIVLNQQEMKDFAEELIAVAEEEL